MSHTYKINVINVYKTNDEEERNKKIRELLVRYLIMKMSQKP